MPDTIVGLLIIVIAIFPGLIGDKIYRVLIGADWREREWQGILRLIGFSVVGVTLYALFSAVLDWYPPVHIFPSTYENISSEGSLLSKIFIPYSGHLVGGGIAGLLGAWGAKLLARFSSSSAFPCAWDQFVRSFVPNHWVVIGLESGEVYAGKLKIADIAASMEERDLVLEEPALYNTETNQYISTSYQFMFIKSKALYSIAVVNEPTIDRRVTPIGDALFAGGESNES